VGQDDPDRWMETEEGSLLSVRTVQPRVFRSHGRGSLSTDRARRWSRRSPWRGSSGDAKRREVHFLLPTTTSISRCWSGGSSIRLFDRARALATDDRGWVDDFCGRTPSRRGGFARLGRRIRFLGFSDVAGWGVGRVWSGDAGADRLRSGEVAAVSRLR